MQSWRKLFIHVVVPIKGFYEQTMLSLHKKIQSNWRGYANMSSSKGVLAAALETKTSIIISERSEREKNTTTILCLFLQTVGLIVNFY